MIFFSSWFERSGCFCKVRRIGTRHPGLEHYAARFDEFVHHTASDLQADRNASRLQLAGVQ